MLPARDPRRRPRDLLQGAAPRHAGRGADGVQVGTVRRVQDNARENIFDGIVLDTEGGRRFVDAPEVARVAEHGVTLTSPSAGGAPSCPAAQRDVRSASR